MTTKLIGLCGYARVGKDAAAAALVDRGWKRLAFADALKRQLEDLGIYAWTTDEAEKERMRPLMVLLGRYRRACDPDYWIGPVLGQIAVDKRRDHCVRHVISDVRYPNEGQAIRDIGGLVVRITRPGVGPRNEEEAQTVARVRWDYEIRNDGTVDELRKRLLHIAETGGR